MYVCMYVCMYFFSKVACSRGLFGRSLGLRPVGASFEASLAQLVMSLGFVSSARIGRLEEVDWHDILIIFQALFLGDFWACAWLARSGLLRIYNA